MPASTRTTYTPGVRLRNGTRAPKLNRPAFAASSALERCSWWRKTVFDRSSLRTIAARSTVCGCGVLLVVNLREDQQLIADRNARVVDGTIGSRLSTCSALPVGTPPVSTEVSTRPLIASGSVAKSGTSRSVKIVPRLPPPASRTPMWRLYFPGGTSIFEMTLNPVCDQVWGGFPP